MDRQAMKYPTSRSLWTQYSSKMLKKGALLSSLDLHEVCIKLSVPITTFYIFHNNLLISSCLTNYFLLILGDRIVSVNGDSVTGRSYAEVVQLIQCTKGYLRLLVVPRQDDILQMVS